MGSLCDSEFRHAHCLHQEAEEPFVLHLNNGCIFRIDNTAVVHHKALLRQMVERRTVEVKFCVRNDEELEGTDDIEQWEIVFFPMYKDDEEISHGAIVDYDDSVVNGNLTITDWQVARCSSNHCDPEYEEVQMPVLNYAKEYVQKILDFRK